MTERENVPMPKACPHCGGAELYHRRVSSGGAHGPYLLLGLGSFLHYAHFDVVVCADCGLTQFFAEPAARQKVKTSEWKKL